MMAKEANILPAVVRLYNMESMNKCILTTVCLFLFLMGCDVTHQEKLYCIDIESAMSYMQTIFVSDLGENVNYIPLETTDSSLIGNRPYIRKFRNTLLVASEKQPIMMFSIENGKFIKTIGNIGHGGNEYILSYDRPIFWTDKNEQYIFVKSAEEKIQQYDSLGNYVGTVKLPEDIGPLSGLSQITIDDYIYFYRNYLFDEQEYKITKVNYNTRQIESTITGNQKAVHPEFIGNLIIFPGFGGIPVSPTCLIHQMKNNCMAFNYMEDPCLWNYNGETYFKKRFNDTIYQIKDKWLQPHYIFDLGNKQIPYDERFKTEGMLDKISIEYILESPKALFFMFKTNHFHIEPNIYWGVYNKLTHEVKISDKHQIKDENNGYVIEEMHTATSDGEIIGLVSVERYMELSRNKQMGSDDNPIAVILE